jgi:predicted PurR-regulated permease PerM/methylmalonyl-CoA mutase cobalamin-binding subunit
MPRAIDTKPVSRLVVLGSVFVVVAALYFAQTVLVPIALAILLSFLLAPLVRLLERARLPRAASVVVAVVLGFGVIGGIGFVVYEQLAELVPRIPEYTRNVEEKIDQMRQPGGLLHWFSHVRSEAQKLASMPNHAATRPGEAADKGPGGSTPDPAAERPAEPAAQKVEVVNQPQNRSPLDQAMSIGGSVLDRVGTALIVLIFTIFMLLQREDLRDKVIRLAGRQRLTTTTEALDDAAGRVSRYLIFQLMTNGGMGLLVCTATWAIGRMAGTQFPSPALWGLLAALLRFIPYVGIWLSALVPIALSFAVFGSIRWTVALFGTYLVGEMVTANVIEPMLFGSSTGLSSLSVLVAAAFWTWLWGPVGLLLSTPLTVCVVVMGKYVPSLQFLNILLSDEPALSPPDRVYQRLLAMDPEEAADLIHEYARTMPLEQLYDEVLLPALTMAESDAHQGGVSPEHRATIRQGIQDLADELGDRLRAEQAKAAGAASKPEPAGRGALAAAPPGTRVHLPQGCVLNVACLPAHGESDQLAAGLLGQLLEARGYCVTVLGTDKLASEMIGAVEASRPDVVVISALPPAAVTHARYLCKRLAEKAPDAELVVGLWTARGDLERARERLAGERPLHVAGTMRAAIARMQEILQPKLINSAMAAQPQGPAAG